jgi:hypothetical protein
MELTENGNEYIYCIYTYIYPAVSNGKRKKEAQSIFLNPLPFALRANGSFSFVRFLRKIQTEGIRLQTDLSIYDTCFHNHNYNQQRNIFVNIFLHMRGFTVHFCLYIYMETSYKFVHIQSYTVHICSYSRIYRIYLVIYRDIPYIFVVKQ